MSDSPKISIKNWAEEDRPREKLLRRGASSLTDSELLAILIGSGNSSESAVELAKRILQRAGNDLYVLGKMDVSEMVKHFKGIGTAKAVTISAALELGRRRKESEIEERKKIGSSRDAYVVLYPVFADLPHEETWALLLDKANKVITSIQVSKGGISSTVVDIRLVLREAINRYASAIILAHNHPSGNLTPGSQDIELTKRMKEAAQWMEISLLDHLIMGDKGYYSFADEGML